MSGEIKSAVRWVSVTTSDVTVTNYRALYIQTDGNINVEGEDGVTAIFAVTAGQVLPVQPKKVLATSTTATCIGLY